VSTEVPTPRNVWGSPEALRNFSVVRKLDGRPWPTGEQYRQYMSTSQVEGLDHLRLQDMTDRAGTFRLLFILLKPLPTLLMTWLMRFPCLSSQ
jgi:hypothetical protein